MNDYTPTTEEVSVNDAIDCNYCGLSVNLLHHTPKPVLPDFFAPKPISGALTYTPTTEEVRAGYSTATYDDAKAEAEFDRWVAEVKAQAWEQGYKSAERNAVFPDRYVLDVNPYRQGD